MSVEFNEPESSVSVRSSNKKPSFFIGIVRKTGLVETDAGAEIVLLIIATVLIALSAVLFVRGNTAPPAPTPADYAL